jgi:threonine dehydratase
MAGQGTAALELHDQVPDLDAVIAPVGGGGLMSGTAVATRALRPTCRIFGAEPTGADDAARGKATGKRVFRQTPNTIADGLLTTLGDRTWPIVRDLVEHVFTVEDPETIAAMRMVYERMKLVIEPSAAVAVAAVLSDSFDAVDPDVQRIGVLITGGNIDLGPLFSSLSRRA